jgi:1,4-alpha-glucan branching enzyme
MLAQSSDWPFIMTSGTMVSYARSRAEKHLLHFRELARQIDAGEIDPGRLKELEQTDNLFPHLDYRLYQKLETTVPVEQTAGAGAP